MSRVYLIRHGKPSQTWGGDDDDPGLDETGMAQAKAAADFLLALPEGERPTRVVSSPLRRCRETAQPFADAIGATVEIDPNVGEIPTPAAIDMAERGGWLRNVFAGTWDAIQGDRDYVAWRRDVAEAVASRPGTAVFSHYVAINAVISQLADEPRVLTFRPDHASISVFDSADGVLTLVRRGPEAQTGVL